MAAAELGLEVDQPVAAVDLRPPQHQRIAAALVEARLARDRQRDSGFARELDLACRKQAAGVGERLDLPVDLSLEIALRVDDLPLRALIVERDEIGVGD